MSEHQQIAELRGRVAKLERAVEFLLRHTRANYVDDPGTTVGADVLALVRQGDKIGAINLYRQRTGADLKTAKDVIDTLE